MKPLFYSLFLISILSGCKKHKNNPSDNPYGLPNASQTGANILACLKNGQPWISQKGSDHMNGGRTDSTFGFWGNMKLSSVSSESLVIYINKLVKTGDSYRLNDTAHQYARYDGYNVTCFAPSGGYGSVNTKAYDGELTLTKVDTINKILSGTFWFNVKTDYCDTMKITDGRFDIRYY